MVVLFVERQGLDMNDINVSEDFLKKFIGEDEKLTSPKYKNYMEVKKAAEGMKSGGKVSSASSRADGCCVKGKTKGTYI